MMVKGRDRMITDGRIIGCVPSERGRNVLVSASYSVRGVDYTCSFKINERGWPFMEEHLVALSVELREYAGPGRGPLDVRMVHLPKQTALSGLLGIPREKEDELRTALDCLSDWEGADLRKMVKKGDMKRKSGSLGSESVWRYSHALWRFSENLPEGIPVKILYLPGAPGKGVVAGIRSEDLALVKRKGFRFSSVWEYL